MSLLPRLKQRAARDLYWACFSHDLMAADCNVAPYHQVLNCFPHLESWFLDIDADPAHLIDHLAQLKSTRLGLYFESLWEYYLRYAGVAELLEKNLQVREGKQTLGECDFIYYCLRRRCHIHLETAVKFYLGVPDSYGGGVGDLAETKAWIGPACRDRLDIKYDALIARQLSLSQTKPGRESLQRLGVENVSKELALKGVLFYPALMSELPSPRGYAHQHKRGVWLNVSQFIKGIDEASLWQVLQRRQWCSPMLTDDEACLLSSNTLHEKMSTYFFDSKNPPIQITSMKRMHDCWVEGRRYFIVPDDWDGDLKR